MTWMDRYTKIWRGGILGLLVVAIVAPWWFDRINVPAQYTCNAPFVRLEGDFCGMPMPGYWIPIFVAGRFIELINGVVMGVPATDNYGDAFLRLLLSSMLVTMLLLPYFSTLVLILRRDGQRLPRGHIVAWGLAVLAALVFGVYFNWSPGSWALWGIWLYSGVAACALGLEVVRWRRGGRLAAGG